MCDAEWGVLLEVTADDAIRLPACVGRDVTEQRAFTVSISEHRACGANEGCNLISFDGPEVDRGAGRRQRLRDRDCVAAAVGEHDIRKPLYLPGLDDIADER